MDQFINQPDFYNQPVRISAEFRNNPLAGIQEFYSFYPLSEVRQFLWDLLETALTSRNLAFAENEKREEIMLFYEQLEKMLEAGYLLNTKNNIQLSA